jgi:hypothetical protein
VDARAPERLRLIRRIRPAILRVVCDTVSRIWDPALNPDEGFVAVFGLKMRLFL